MSRRIWNVTRLLAVVLVAALLALVLAFSCGAFRGSGVLPGDNYRDIYFTNRTDVPVLVYERYPAGTTSPDRVAPGGTFHDQVIVPFVRDLSMITTPRRFEAMTETGEIIYCRTLTYRELDGLTWRLMVDGTLGCP
jgi:hypothetical protein